MMNTLHRRLTLKSRISQSFQRTFSTEWFSNGQNFQIDNLELGLCKSRMGQLSESSAVASSGGSLVHVTINSKPAEGAMEDFLPLTVDYREKMHSYNGIPGGFKKSEKHNNDHEILASRVIDRAIRSLFPKGYTNEVQVIATAHAFDRINDPVVLAVNAASLALYNSNQPWTGPIGCVRVGLVNDELKVNPTMDELKASPLNLLFAGTKDRVVMIEAEGQEVPEDQMIRALEEAQNSVKKIVEEITIKSSDAQLLKKKSYLRVNNEIYSTYKQKYWGEILDVYSAGKDNKQDRSQLEGLLRATMIADVEKNPDWTNILPLIRIMTIDSLMHDGFRYAILKKSNENEHIRSDGRTQNTLRPLDCKVSVLPVVHGSAYFQRGDTHVLCTTTLGHEEKCIELPQYDPLVKEKDYFMLHYDMPPYATGEVGDSSPGGRRTVGHGKLAEKALRAVLPSFERFAYTIRVNSECTSSNGSSSMASVCGASLALSDAGVPISSLVAGISVGLITEPDFNKKSSENIEGDYVLLKDILGSEDHHGDMDFKIAGTRDGINAIQLDVKLFGGIPLNILSQGLGIAKEARFSILDLMEKQLEGKSISLKPTAPRAECVVINSSERLKHVIGPGGEMLRNLEKLYDIEICLLQDCVPEKVYIYGFDHAKVLEARQLVEDIVVEIEPGAVILSTVSEVKDFGLIMKVNSGQLGLLHVSEISHDQNILKTPLNQLFKLGHKFQVEVVNVIAETGLLRLSRKSIIPISMVPDNELIELSKQTPIINDTLTDKIPTTPPQTWDASYFRDNVVSPNLIPKSKFENKKNFGDEKGSFKKQGKYGNDKKYNNNNNNNSNNNNNRKNKDRNDKKDRE